MVFNSFDFLLFFVIVFALFWSLPFRYRWILLLISSYFFYMYWNPVYGLLLLGSTSLDYFLAVHLTGSENPRKRRAGLYLSLTIHLTILFSFKYSQFFLDASSELLSLFNISYVPPELDILLPVGISFYTFQTLSYTIDVYRQEIQPEKSFGKFALFVSFFPQLVAGPIERAGDLLPQLKRQWFRFTSDHLRIGLIYCLWGFFMKVVVADNIADLVDPIYLNVHEQSSGALAYASILFSFQIYTDFAGYSYIALGIAKLLDFDLMLNFKFPFLTQSVTSFWRSWHISLSIWTRDYIYIPLGGKRRGKLLTYRNLMVVFLVIGLWHGASYNFIVWGFLHGLVMIIERFSGYNRDSSGIIRYARYLINFVIVTLIFIPFRAATLDETVYIYKEIFQLNWRELYVFFADNRYSPALIGVVILMTAELILNRREISTVLHAPKIVRYPLYIFLFFAILLCGKSDGSQFIYFQF